MADFKDFIITGLLFGLFLIAVVSFGAQLSLDNNSNNTILQDPNINRTLVNMSNTLTQVQGVSENQSASQDETKPIALFDFLFESIIGTVKIFKATASTIYNVTLGLLISTLGIPVVVLSTFTAIILIILIFRAWRNFKTGT